MFGVGICKFKATNNDSAYVTAYLRGPEYSATRWVAFNVDARRNKMKIFASLSFCFHCHRLLAAHKNMPLLGNRSVHTTCRDESHVLQRKRAPQWKYTHNSHARLFFAVLFAPCISPFFYARKLFGLATFIIPQSMQIKFKSDALFLPTGLCRIENSSNKRFWCFPGVFNGQCESTESFSKKNETLPGSGHLHFFHLAVFQFWGYLIKSIYILDEKFKFQYLWYCPIHGICNYVIISLNSPNVFTCLTSFGSNDILIWIRFSLSCRVIEKAIPQASLDRCEIFSEHVGFFYCDPCIISVMWKLLHETRRVTRFRSETSNILNCQTWAQIDATINQCY